LEERAIVPKGLLLAANVCDGPLQADLRHKAGSFEIVDEEGVKPEASVTPVDSSNRKVVEMCMLACAAVPCRAHFGVQHVRWPGVARSRGGAVMYLSNQDVAVLMVSSNLSLPAQSAGVCSGAMVRAARKGKGAFIAYNLKLGCVIRFEVCRPNGPECLGVRWSAPVREPPSRAS
jgi:hypothetical protein